MSAADPIETEDADVEDKVGDLPKQLLKDKHSKFFKHMLGLLPEAYQSHDSSRLTLLYFSLSCEYLRLLVPFNTFCLVI